MLASQAISSGLNKRLLDSFTLRRKMMSILSRVPMDHGKLISHKMVGVPNGQAPYKDGSLPMNWTIEFKYEDCTRQLAGSAVGPCRDDDWSIKTDKRSEEKKTQVAPIKLPAATIIDTKKAFVFQVENKNKTDVDWLIWKIGRSLARQTEADTFKHLYF